MPNQQLMSSLKSKESILSWKYALCMSSFTSLHVMKKGGEASCLRSLLFESIYLSRYHVGIVIYRYLQQTETVSNIGLTSMATNM